MKPTPITDEKDLLLKLRDGNEAAFTEVYNRYWQPLYLYAYKRLKDDGEAADVVQDVFAALWKHTRTAPITTSLKAYLYTAARNHTLNAIGRSGRRDAYVKELAEVYEDGHDATDQEVGYRELARLLEEAIAQLPPRMRAVYTKSKEEGLSHQQIGEELGISADTSKTTLSRALTFLRTKLIPLWGVLVLLFR